VSDEAVTYGNWVSAKLVAFPGAVGGLFAAAALFVPWLGILAGGFLLISGYFAYARRVFSPRGRDVQDRMVGLGLSRLPAADWEGMVLDVGCGSGALAVRIAKRCPGARIVGIDRWGPGWESSEQRCQQNARIEGVADRISFVSGDAASLPFDDDSFDAVVSNFVFHEVHGVREKRALLQEALRVLKPGGVFVFQDLFLWRRVYGPIDELLAEIRGWGLARAEFVDTSRSPFVPRALKLPFMLGTAGILYGRK